MTRTRWFFVALAAVTSAAAHAQGVRVKLPAWAEPVLLDSMRQEQVIAGTPEAVYSATLHAFADLGIPIGNTDNAHGIIGSEKFDRLHSLAGAPMSRSFSCGESATGPNADSYRLSIAIVVWVSPSKDGGTTLGLAAAASGADISGVYRNPRECASTGWIEGKIIAGVQKYVK
jgi:hypothetical protein